MKAYSVRDHKNQVNNLEKDVAEEYAKQLSQENCFVYEVLKGDLVIAHYMNGKRTSTV